MAKNRKHKATTRFFARLGACNVRKPVCTAKHASQLLDELRRAYQALAPEERRQVKAFITELSCMANTG
jgi:hypothetical protein